MMKISRYIARSIPVQAHELGPGMIVKLDQGYIEVTSYRHLKTGQGHTDSIVNYMDLATYKFGKLHVNTHHRFDKVEPEYVPAVVQFFDKEKAVVSESKSFEQIDLPLSLFQRAEQLFPSGTQITLVKDDEEVIKIALSPDKLEELRKLKPKDHGKR